MLPYINCTQHLFTANLSSALFDLVSPSNYDTSNVKFSTKKKVTPNSHLSGMI